MGWMSKASSFNKLDDKLGLWLLMVTHLQAVLGLTLYFVSPVVIFSGASMKDPVARYWLVEHSTMMIIAVILITVGRVATKKLTDVPTRYKKLFLYNGIALLLILVAIIHSGRGFLNLPTY